MNRFVRLASGQMIIDEIKERLSPEFQPFAIRLSDGRRFNVPHRDFIALGSKIVVVIDEREISHTINPVHIVSLEETARSN